MAYFFTFQHSPLEADPVYDQIRTLLFFGAGTDDVVATVKRGKFECHQILQIMDKDFSYECHLTEFRF